MSFERHIWNLSHPATVKPVLQWQNLNTVKHTPKWNRDSFWSHYYYRHFPPFFGLLFLLLQYPLFCIYLFFWNVYEYLPSFHICGYFAILSKDQPWWHCFIDQTKLKQVLWSGCGRGGNPLIWFSSTRHKTVFLLFWCPWFLSPVCSPMIIHSDSELKQPPKRGRLTSTSRRAAGAQRRLKATSSHRE